MVISEGKISIRDLQFDCIIGTLPFERKVEQPVVLNVSLWLDFTQAARNEDLAHTVDYAQLADELQKFIRVSQFQLVETLVVETSKFILDNCPVVRATEVSIRKPNAIPGCKGAEASITATR